MSIRGNIAHSRTLDIYIGCELAVVPVFQSEIAPEKARGFVVGTYQISLFVSFSALPPGALESKLTLRRQ